jgi:hypothetical protein
MREALFAELQESVRDAVDHPKGATVSRADRFRRPKKLKLAEIRGIRIKWGVNQLVFGKRLGGRECSCSAGLGARKASSSRHRSATTQHRPAQPCSVSPEGLMLRNAPEPLQSLRTQIHRSSRPQDANEHTNAPGPLGPAAMFKRF